MGAFEGRDASDERRFSEPSSWTDRPAVSQLRVTADLPPTTPRQPSERGRAFIPPPPDRRAEVPPTVADLVHPADGIRRQGGHAQRAGITPRDRLTGQLVDVGRTGLESTLWKAGEVVAAQLHPVGTYVVLGLYLTKQIVEVFKSKRSNDGFYFKVSVPGLDLPLGLKLVFRIRLDYRHQDAADYGFGAEIQIFQPWLANLDVKHRLPNTAEELASGVPPAYAPDALHDDPWHVWLVLIGDDLIHELAITLAKATTIPVDEILARMLAQREVGWDEAHSIPDPGAAA